jgi:hypothetical protein
MVADGMPDRSNGEQVPVTVPPNVSQPVKLAVHVEPEQDRVACSVPPVPPVSVMSPCQFVPFHVTVELPEQVPPVRVTLSSLGMVLPQHVVVTGQSQLPSALGEIGSGVVPVPTDDVTDAVPGLQQSAADPSYTTVAPAGPLSVAPIPPLPIPKPANHEPKSPSYPQSSVW